MPDNPIDLYLAGLAEPKRSTLEALRGMLLDLVPGAVKRRANQRVHAGRDADVALAPLALGLRHARE